MSLLKRAMRPVLAFSVALAIPATLTGCSKALEQLGRATEPERGKPEPKAPERGKPAAGEALNIRDFGAVGDGIKNDTAAIQAALDAVQMGGGIVYIPPGTYIVAPAAQGNALAVHSNTTVRGDGPRSIIKVIRDAGNYNSIFGSDHEISITHVENVVLENFKIDQNPLENSKGDLRTDEPVSLFQYAIVFFSVRNLTVQDMRLDPVCGMNSIVANGDDVADVVIQRNFIRFVRGKSTQTGAYLYDNSAIYVEGFNHKILNNTCVADISQKAYGCIETHGGSPSLVAYNESDGYQTGVNIVSWFAEDNVQANNIEVRENTFKRANFAIHLNSGTNKVLKGVKVLKNKITIAQKDHNECCSTGIDFLNTDYPEDRGDFSDVLVEDNDITFQDESADRSPRVTFLSHGIGLSVPGLVEKVTVARNTIRNAPAVGIRVGNPTGGKPVRDVKIVNNTIIDAGLSKGIDDEERASFRIGGRLENVQMTNNRLVDTGTRSCKGKYSVYCDPEVQSSVRLGSNSIVSATPGCLKSNLKGEAQPKRATDASSGSY